MKKGRTTTVVLGMTMDSMNGAYGEHAVLASLRLEQSLTENSIL
jgi:hypothetical protein